MTTTRTLQIDGGTIAYDVSGTADPHRPLVICVPGMGELRSSFRHTVTALVGAGYRVATFDLRGHGHSSTTFPENGERYGSSSKVAISVSAPRFRAMSWPSSATSSEKRVQR